MNFISQSNLQKIKVAAQYDLRGQFSGSVSNRVTLRMSLIYIVVWILGLALFLQGQVFYLGFHFSFGLPQGMCSDHLLSGRQPWQVL